MPPLPPRRPATPDDDLQLFNATPFGGSKLEIQALITEIEFSDKALGSAMSSLLSGHTAGLELRSAQEIAEWVWDHEARYGRR